MPLVVNILQAVTIIDFNADKNTVLSKRFRSNTCRKTENSCMSMHICTSLQDLCWHETKFKILTFWSTGKKWC